MKKLITTFLALFIISMANSPVNAEFIRTRNKTLIIYASVYTPEKYVQKSNIDFRFDINLTHFFWVIYESRDQYHSNIFIEFKKFNLEKEKQPNLLLNVKNLPKITLVNKGEKIDLDLSKVDKTRTSGAIHLELDAAILKMLKNADQILIEYPLENGKKQKFKLPKEIIDEWQYILNVDMIEESKAFGEYY